MSRILEGLNHATPDEAASFVDQYEEFEKQLQALQIEHMNKVRAVRNQQNELLDDAKEQGVPKKVVKGVAKARSLEAKAAAIRDEFEDDDRKTFIDIRKALGDFADSPLGAAAVEREDEQDDTTAAIVDAVKGSMPDEDWDRAGPAH